MARVMGICGVHPRVLEYPRDLTLAVGNVQFLRKHSDDALTRPDVASEAVGFGTVPEKVRDPPKLFVGNLCCRSRAWTSAQGFWTLASCRGEPLTDGTLGHIQSEGNGMLFPAQLGQFQRSDAPPFFPVMRLRIRWSHALLYAGKNLTLLCNAQ